MRLSLIFILSHLSVLLYAQEEKLNVEYYQLPNGLKVYLNPDPDASNVYGAVWVNAGAKNDPADATGIAHYLEHMLFKGTTELGTQDYESEKIHLDSIQKLYDQLTLAEEEEEKQKIQIKINDQALLASKYAIPNEFDRLLKSIGASGVNAGTNYDYTYYHNSFPANQINKWLDIYAHRFQDPIFRLFQSELEAVYEEKNRAQDNLQRRVYAKFDEYIYGDHPYSTQTVLGSVDHLKNPSLTKMYEYFQKYYVPNNMALVLSGKFNPSEIKPFIEGSFGKLKKGESPNFPEMAKSSFDGRKLEKVRITPIKAGFMGYKLVPISHPDRPALELIGEMMTNNDQTGFIDQWNLNNEVFYAGANQRFLEEDGSTFIFYVPKLFGGSLRKFEKKIQASFQALAEGKFSDEFFESNKYSIYKNFELSLEDLDARARYLGLSFIYDIDYKDFLSFPDKVNKLSKEDIQEAARKYYGDDYFTLQSRTGFPKKIKIDKPNYKAISERTEAISNYAEYFNELVESPVEPNFIDFDKDFNLIDEYIYNTKNTLNDVFSIKLKIAGGIAKEPFCGLLSEALNNTGTTNYNASELKNKFAQLGASYQFDFNYNSFDITLTGVNERFDQSIDLLVHLLKGFDPDKKLVERLYSQRKTDNELSKNNPSTGGSILYSYGLFGDVSSYKSRLPIKELKKLEPSTLKNKLESLLSNGFSSIHYVGNKSDHELKTSISSFKILKKNEVDIYTFLEARDVRETTFYLVNDKKAVQSYVYYIVNGEPLDPENDHKKEAFNAYYTNGLSGLLFQEVREFRSLAYATGGNYIDPSYEAEKRGRLVLFTGSQADKTTEAVRVVLGLINDMPQYEKRLTSIKEGLIQESSSSKPNFRDLSATSEVFLKSGYKQDPNKINYPKYSELDFEDITSFYNKNIKGKPVTICIYGDVSRFNINALKSMGKVVELEMADIMVE